MVRWHSASVKAAVAIGALTSLLVSSGAGLRWGDLTILIKILF
jgi:hypothetical protein